MSLALDKCIPAKSSEELIALLRSGTDPQRIEAAASLANEPEAVFVLIHAAEKDASERVRELALTSLLDTLLNREHFVTEKTVGVFIRATLKDKSEPVRNMSDISLVALAHDYPDLVLPALSKAEKKEKAKGSLEVERLTSTLMVVRSLCELAEKPKPSLPEIAKRNSPAEIEKIKERKEPQKLRLVA